mgnify:FL=1
MSKMSPEMPATDNEIREKYLERAIRELNQLSRDIQTCDHCPRGNVMPVLGSGQRRAGRDRRVSGTSRAAADEAVAFDGRAGNALMKSFKRLGIDPLSVYGTICLKCPVEDPADESPECIQRVAEEFNIVQPRIMVVMGDDALEALNGMEIPLSRPVEARLGEIQAFTPACDVLVVPDIDESLDEEGAKRRFWRAFRTLGRWHDDLPPY